MVQGLLGRKDRNNGSGNSNGYDTSQNGVSQSSYVDYLAEARHQLDEVKEYSDEQAYQVGMLNALIGIGYELRKINKFNRSTQ